MAGKLLFLNDLPSFFRSWTTHNPQGHTKLPDYVPVGQFPKTPLRDLFTAASADTLNLLSKCLIYEPRKRITAREVHFFNFFFIKHSQLIHHPGPASSILLRSPLSYIPLKIAKVHNTDGGKTLGGSRRQCGHELHRTWRESAEQHPKTQACVTRRWRGKGPLDSAAVGFFKTHTRVLSGDFTLAWICYLGRATEMRP
jgi:hypothetical protein